MEINKFNELNLSLIEKYILVSLQRVIPQITDVVVSIDTDYCNRQYIKVKSSVFQTTPVIFKEIWIEGSCCNPSYDEEKNCFNLGFNFHYNWSQYNGGTNGTDFGYMRLTAYCKDSYNDIVLRQPFTYSNINPIYD